MYVRIRKYIDKEKKDAACFNLHIMFQLFQYPIGVYQQHTVYQRTINAKTFSLFLGL